MANEQQDCDILIIGSGEAGKWLAWTMAPEGYRTVVVERKLVGGSCPNIACMPSKNIIHSAKVHSYISRAAEFGVEIDKAVTNMAGVQARKRATSPLTSTWPFRRQGCGPWATVPAAHSSLMWRSTTSAWCTTLCMGAPGQRRGAWCRFACSPTQNWRGSA